MNEMKIAQWKLLSPVLLPACLVASLTIALRVATEMQNHGVIENGTFRSLNDSANSFNSTEATYLQIADAYSLLNQGNDYAAIEELRVLQDAPLSIAGSNFQDEKIKSFSPQSLLTGIGHTLASRAVKRQKAGDDIAARQYIQALYSIGDNILASKDPTIKGLELVHYFHGLAAKTEARLYPGNSLTNLLQKHQHAALQLLWDQQIRPQIEFRASSSGRNETPGEQAIAARLIAEYRNEWIKIRSNEA